MRTAIVIMLQCMLVAVVLAGDDGARGQAIEKENSPAVSGGLNISMITVPTMVDYVNMVSTIGDAAAQFATGIELFSAVEYPVGDSWGVKIDYGYIFKSYTVLVSGGTEDIFYAVHAPSLLVQYVTSGKGYFLKLGAGGGYHLGHVEIKTSTFGTTIFYKANGIGLKTELTGQTALSENVYVHLGGTLRWELLGTVTDEYGKPLNSRVIGSRNVSLSLFAAGIEIGVAWYL